MENRQLLGEKQSQPWPSAVARASRFAEQRCCTQRRRQRHYGFRTLLSRPGAHVTIAD